MQSCKIEINDSILISARVCYWDGWFQVTSIIKFFVKIEITPIITYDERINKYITQIIELMINNDITGVER